MLQLVLLGSIAIAAAADTLGQPVSLDFEQAPLETVAAHITNTCGVHIMLDEAALDAEGLKRDVPVSIHVSKRPLRSALQRILGELGLSYTVADGAVLVTSRRAAEATMVNKVYPVDDLLNTSSGEQHPPKELLRLAQLIRETIQPANWETVGGPGTVEPAETPGVQALAVSQSWQGQEEIAALLHSIRKVARQAAEGQMPSTVLVPDTPEAQVVRGALERPITVDFDSTPLGTVTTYLAKLSGVDVLLDRRSLEYVGLPIDAPVTLRAKDLPLRSLLQQLLMPLDLKYVVRNDALLITTPEEAELRLTLAICPVADLIGEFPNAIRTDRELKTLAGAITATILPASWDSMGGPGSITPARLANAEMLVIAQTREVLEETSALLEAIRSMAGNPDETDVLLYDGRFKRTPRVEQIREALRKPFELQVIEQPFSSVVDHLRRTYQIDVALDTRALDDVWITGETPITQDLSGLPLRSGLRWMLFDLELTYVIRDGVLAITTHQEMESVQTLGVYSVGDLLGVGRERIEGPKKLKTAITTCIQPSTWDATGGPGGLATVRLEGLDAMLVSQSQNIHEEVASLLKALRVAGQRDGGPQQYVPILLYDGRYEENPAAVRIRKALEQKVSLDFDEQPLGDVLDYCQDFYGIPIKLDPRELEDVGLGSDLSVTLHMSNVPLGAALRQILSDRGLTPVICGEVLFITSPDEAKNLLVTGVYPVGDLAVCRDDDDRLWYDYDSLAKIVTTAVPDSWETTLHGPGQLVGGTFGKAKVLVISQTLQAHEGIAALLGKLRAEAALAGNQEPPRRSRPPVSGTDASKRPKRMGGGVF